jgi:hypothetical protein
MTGSRIKVEKRNMVLVNSSLRFEVKGERGKEEMVAW